MYTFDSKNHLHTLAGKPLTGTSTVIKVISKPLTWWASGLAVGTLGWVKAADWKTLKTDEEKKADFARRTHACMPYLDMIRGMSAGEYLTLLDKAYRAHVESLDKSANKGTDLHAELERYVKTQMGKLHGTDFDPKIKPFIDWAELNVKKFIVSEGNVYSEKMWTGGIVDCVAELNNGEYAVIDFKSSKEAYKSQFIQCAGYALQLEENGVCDATGQYCKKLDKPITQLIVVPFGSPRPAPVVMRGVDEFKKAFEAAVVLYRLLENYNE